MTISNVFNPLKYAHLNNKNNKWWYWRKRNLKGKTVHGTKKQMCKRRNNCAKKIRTLVLIRQASMVLSITPWLRAHMVFNIQRYIHRNDNATTTSLLKGWKCTRRKYFYPKNETRSYLVSLETQHWEDAHSKHIPYIFIASILA